MGDGRLDGRVAVITGGASGMRRATAEVPNIVKHLGIGANRRGGVNAGVSHGTTGRKATVRPVWP